MTNDLLKVNHPLENLKRLNNENTQFKCGGYKKSIDAKDIL